jgi:hypothetical protein
MKTGYYVTIVRGKRVGYLVGPCSSEPIARTYLDAARREAEEIDPFTHFDLFGTAKVTASHLPPGVLNERVECHNPTEAEEC